MKCPHCGSSDVRVIAKGQTDYSTGKANVSYKCNQCGTVYKVSEKQ